MSKRIFSFISVALDILLPVILIRLVEYFFSLFLFSSLTIRPYQYLGNWNMGILTIIGQNFELPYIGIWLAICIPLSFFLFLFACSRMSCVIGTIFSESTWRYPSTKYSRFFQILFLSLMSYQGVIFLYKLINYGLFSNEIVAYTTGSPINLGTRISLTFLAPLLLYLRLPFSKDHVDIRPRALVLRSFHSVNSDRYLPFFVSRTLGTEIVTVATVNPVGSNYREYKVSKLPFKIFSPFNRHFELLAPSDLLWQDLITNEINKADYIFLDISNLTKGLQWEMETLPRLVDISKNVILVYDEEINLQRSQYHLSWINNLRQKTNVYL